MTAYEVRISDWSSDVCSSDLRTTTGEIEALGFMNALLAVQAYRQALEIDPDNAIITDDDRFTIVCDSKYVISTYEDHLTTWIRNKWRKSTRGAIAHQVIRSEEHTSELQSLMRISYAVFCLKKKKQKK